MIDTQNTVAVDSSTLQNVAYDNDKKALILTFASGSLYEYAGVPPSVVRGLLLAPSKGRYFNEHIKTRYPYKRRFGRNV